MSFATRTSAAALALLCAFASPAPARASGDDAWVCDRSPLLVTNATLWTPEARLARHEFLVENGRITVLGPAGATPRTRAARILDVQGRLVVPGLIDAHAHFGIGGPLPPDAGAPRTRSLAITGRQSLRAGVTQTRVHLWDLELGPSAKASASDDCFPAPRMALGGPGLGGGVPELRGSNYTGVSDSAHARRLVKAARAAGADWQSVHDLDRFGPGELEAIVAQARRSGLRLMAQGYRRVEIELAVAWGFDSIEYLPLQETGLLPAELVARTARADSRIVFVPQIGSYERMVHNLRHPAALSAPFLHEFMPAHMASHLRAALPAELERRDIESGVSGKIDLLRRQFGQLLRSGASLAIGTDCGSPGIFHRDAIWWELSSWIAHGATVDHALRAATSDAARLLALGEEVGTLAVGRRGDFVVLDGSPAAPVLQHSAVRTVSKGGVLYVDRGEWVGP